MTALDFVDANVFDYALDPRERVKRPLAAAWIERLWRERCGRTSAQVLTGYRLHRPRGRPRRRVIRIYWPV